MNNNIAVKFENVSKTYDNKKYILNNLNIEIKKGSYVEIKGRSGSGKSTLLNIIGLLDTSFEGKLYINGQDTSILSDTQISKLRNRHIGFVFQAYNLINNMTVEDNIYLPMIYSSVLPDYEFKSHITNLMNEFQIAELAKKRFNFCQAEKSRELP